MKTEAISEPNPAGAALARSFDVPNDETCEPFTVEEYRAFLVLDVLDVAVSGPIDLFTYRLKMLVGGQLLSKWGRHALGDAYKKALNAETCLEELIAGRCGHRRILGNTFAESVVALRGFANRTLDEAGQQEMERLIVEMHEAYAAAIRVIYVSQQENPVLTAELPRLPEIPPNPYLKLSNSEVAA